MFLRAIAIFPFFSILNTFFCPSLVSMSAYRRTQTFALAISTFFSASFFAVLYTALHYYPCQWFSFLCLNGFLNILVPPLHVKYPFPALHLSRCFLSHFSPIAVSDPRSLSSSPVFLPCLSAVSFSRLFCKLITTPYVLISTMFS